MISTEAETLFNFTNNKRNYLAAFDSYPANLANKLSPQIPPNTQANQLSDNSSSFLSRRVVRHN